MNRDTQKKIDKIIKGATAWITLLAIGVIIGYVLKEQWKINFCRWYVSWIYEDVNDVDFEPLKLWDYCAVSSDNWTNVAVLIKID